MFARRVYSISSPIVLRNSLRGWRKTFFLCFGNRKGFQDEITFVGQGGTEAFGISLWIRGECRGLQPRNLPRSNEAPRNDSRRSPSG